MQEKRFVMKELRIEADTEKLHEVVAFVEEQLEEMGCPMKTRGGTDPYGYCLDE